MDTAIVTLGSEILRERARPVTFDADLAVLIEKMRAAMRAHDGIGIAAPQVGVSIRLFLIAKDLFPQNVAEDVFVNPTIIKKSFKRERMEEGCLSVPGVFGEVSRCARVTVEALNAEGKRFRITAEGLLARVLQHELDHLEGILFIDRAEKETLHEVTPKGTIRPWKNPTEALR
jgi:peptide deformylase